MYRSLVFIPLLILAFFFSSCNKTDHFEESVFDSMLFYESDTALKYLYTYNFKDSCELNFHKAKYALVKNDSNNVISNLDQKCDFTLTKPERIFLLKGILFFNTRVLDSAELYLKKAIDLNIKYGDKHNVNMNKLFLSWVYTSQSNLKKSNSILLELKDSFTELPLLSNTYRLLSRNYDDLSEYENAFSSIEKFKYYATRANIISDLIHVHNHKGTLFMHENKFEEARREFGLSNEIALKISDTLTYYQNLSWLGLIYEKENELDSAYALYKEVRQYSKNNNILFGISSMSGNMAEILLSQRKNLSKAFKLISESKSINRASSNKYGLMYDYNILGNYFFIKRQFSIAHSYLDSAETLAIDVGDKALRSKIYKHKYSVFEKQKKYLKAIEYLKLHHELKDSLVGQKATQDLASLNLNLEKEKSQSLENELKQSLLNKKQQAKISFLILTSLLFVLITIISLWRNQKIKSKQQKLAIESSNEKIKWLQQNILNKNQMLEELSLKQESKINTNLKNENDWLSFLMEFKKLHPHYLEKYENILSKSELRMQMLLKLHISNKEIADLLNITLEGVKKSKQRIKKKLTVLDN